MMRRSDHQRRVYQSDYFTVIAQRQFLTAALHNHISAGSKVADLGCGEAPLRKLVEGCGGNYLGLDIEANSTGSTGVLASLNALPLKDASFDVTLCTEVLEHLYDSAAGIVEIARILKPGGVAIVTVPFLYPLHEEPYDFGRPTRFAIEESCRRAGLEIEQLMLLGDEMQVVASTLDNAWTRIVFNGPGHQLWRAARVVLRLTGNLFYGALSLALTRVLPRKAYLGHALVARKLATG